MHKYQKTKSKVLNTSRKVENAEKIIILNY